MSAREEIHKIFGMLDDWRHLPAYQLERRVDPFFAMYLPHVLETCCDVKIKECLVPEFPIKKKDNNRSIKADYLAISKDGKRVFLIELKTDMNSRSNPQDDAYEQARKTGLRCLVDGIIGIRQYTEQRQKYDKLLCLLAELDLVCFEKHQRKIVERYKNMVGEPEPCIEVLYIQPKPCQANNVITFCQFARAIEDHGEVAKLFAGYLRHWAEVEAGDQCGEPSQFPESAS